MITSGKKAIPLKYNVDSFGDLCKSCYYCTCMQLGRIFDEIVIKIVNN